MCITRRIDFLSLHCLNVIYEYSVKFKFYLEVAALWSDFCEQWRSRFWLAIWPWPWSYLRPNLDPGWPHRSSPCWRNIRPAWKHLGLSRFLVLRGQMCNQALLTHVTRWLPRATSLPTSSTWPFCSPLLSNILAHPHISPGLPKLFQFLRISLA